MSIGRVNNSAAGNRNLAVRNLASSAPRVTKPWKVNPSWPVITVPSSSEQKIVGLYAVFPGDGSGNGGNFLAVNCAGDYTVDYGDGTVTNYATGVQANYEFNFNSAALAETNAPVTFADAGDLVQRTAHGYSNGDEVQFFNIVSTTGLTEAARYFVINAAADSFQVSMTEGGSAVALTTNGSATLLPYKIAVVTITAQAGQDLTSINLNLRHTSAALAAYTSGWLDLAIAAPQLTTLTLGLATNLINWDLTQRFRCSSLGILASLSYAFNGWRGLESVSLEGTGSVLDASFMFSSCFSLTSVPLFNTAAVTNMQSMFTACYSLTSVPLFDTAAVTNMQSMFNACYSLTSVPLFNTAAVTVMQSMFNNCYPLTSVPLFNTAAVTNMASMFNNCYSLTSVPLFNTAAVTVMQSMFTTCYSLTSVPLFNTAAVTTMQSMFSGCVILTSVPLFNTAAVTVMQSMFSSCFSLTSVPLFNTAAVTNMQSMFNNCFSLTSVPLFNTAAVGSMQSMFNNCHSLTSVPLFNTAAVTNMASMLSSCFSLTSVPALVMTAIATGGAALMCINAANLTLFRATGCRFSINFASCKLSAAALNEIFTNLGTASGAQTITITNNYGAATCTRSIATAKGWTVTG